jgi:hypothetical protein
MNTGELYRSAFSLYRMHFKKLFLINLVQVAAMFFLGIFGFIIGAMGGLASIATGNKIWIALAYLISLVPSVIGVFVSAAMLFAISNAVLGRPIHARESYRRAWSVELLWKLLVLSIPFVILSAGISLILQFLAGYPFLLLCFLPFEYLILTISAIMMTFLSPIAVLEKRGILSSVGRLFSLFVGNIGRLLLNYGLFWFIPVYILSIVLTFIFAFPIGMIVTSSMTDPVAAQQVNMSVGTVIGFLVSLPITMFITPFGTLLSILLYYDTRARKENYNETLLAEEMGQELIPELI